MEIHGLILNQLRQTTGNSNNKPASLAASLMGRLAKAVAVKLIDTDRILLDLLGHKIEAPNTLGLKPGQEIMVRVGRSEQAPEMVNLTVLTQPSTATPVQKLILSAQADHKPLGPLVKGLIEALNDLSDQPKKEVRDRSGRIMASLRKTMIQPRPEQSTAKVIRQLKALPTRLGLNLESGLAKEIQSKTMTSATGDRSLPPAVMESADGIKPRLIGLAKSLAALTTAENTPGQIHPGLTKAFQETVERLVVLVRPEQNDLPEKIGDENSRLPKRQALATIRNDLVKRIDRLFDRAERITTQEKSLPREDDPARGNSPNRKKATTIRQEARRTVMTAWPRLLAAVQRNPVQAQTQVMEVAEVLNRLLDRLGLTPKLQAQNALNQVQATIRSLETTQTVNSVATEQDSTVMIPIPLALPTENTAGELYMFQSKKRSGDGTGDGPLRLVFLLDMKKLGPVRIDLGLNRKLKELMVNIYLSTDRAADFTRNQMTGLSGRLSGLGYKISSMAVRRLESAPSVESIAPQIAPIEYSSMIDVKA